MAAGVAQARDAAGAALADNAFGIMCSPLFLPTYTLVKTAADAMMVSRRGTYATAPPPYEAPPPPWRAPTPTPPPVRAG